MVTKPARAWSLWFFKWFINVSTRDPTEWIDAMRPNQTGHGRVYCIYIHMYIYIYIYALQYVYAAIHPVVQSAASSALLALHTIRLTAAYQTSFSQYIDCLFLILGRLKGNVIAIQSCKRPHNKKWVQKKKRSQGRREPNQIKLHEIKHSFTFIFTCSRCKPNIQRIRT